MQHSLTYIILLTSQRLQGETNFGSVFSSFDVLNEIIVVMFEKIQNMTKTLSKDHLKHRLAHGPKTMYMHFWLKAMCSFYLFSIN